MTIWYKFSRMLAIYRVIRKSLRDFRPLRYSSRNGQAEGNYINRGRDTPIFCPTLQVLDMPFLLCLSWLLRIRFRKFRRDLWITLYIWIKPPVVHLWPPLNRNQSTRTMQAQFCCSGCHKSCYIKTFLNFQSSVTSHSPTSWHSCQCFSHLRTHIGLVITKCIKLYRAIGRSQLAKFEYLFQW